MSPVIDLKTRNIFALKTICCNSINMPAHGFSLTRIFPYKDRIVDKKMRIRENLFSGAFYAVQVSDEFGEPKTLKYVTFIKLQLIISLSLVIFLS